MNPREVEFLRRLLADCATERRHGEVADRMVTAEGVGTIKGARVVYTTADHDKAVNLLKSRGFDLVGPKENFSRSEAPRGGSEKSGAQRVSNDLVAVVPMAMPDLRLPPGSMLALSSRAAQDLSYETLLVCENLEPLLQLHTYGWLAEFTCGRATLALFRGAPGYYRTDAAAGLIQRDTRPTLAFFDFDPKGLSMAGSLPRRQGLCLPPWPVLRAAALANKRTHLFTNSAHLCRPHLDGGGLGDDIATAWARLKELSLGLDQEHFPRSGGG